MANINETNTWTDGIYEIATTDDVIGGSDGISNRQATQLASRTNYLKGRTSDLENGKTPAGKANRLSTARTIAISGDASGNVIFDGSENVTIALTQKDTGIKAGSYRQVVVDAKGRVTDGGNPTTLTGYGITDAASMSYVQNNYQPILGYTPIQQGTGIGQASNPVKIGWDDVAKLKLTVGNIDLGNIALESWVLAQSYTSLPAGTRLPFAQSTAPTGWTQVSDDTTNNRMLRVVNGGGGNVGGSHSPIVNNVVPAHTHWFSTGNVSADHSHVIQDPGHAHGVYDPGHSHVNTAGDAGSGPNLGSGNNNSRAPRNGGAAATTGIALYAAATGIWNSGITSNHTHSGSTDNGSSQTNWQPRYIDMIICKKN